MKSQRIINQGVLQAPNHLSLTVAAFSILPVWNVHVLLPLIWMGWKHIQNSHKQVFRGSDMTAEWDQTKINAKHTVNWRPLDPAKTWFCSSEQRGSLTLKNSLGKQTESCLPITNAYLEYTNNWIKATVLCLSTRRLLIGTSDIHTRQFINLSLC